MVGKTYFTLEYEEVRDIYPDEILKMVYDFVLDNNDKKSSLKICSVWYGIEDGDRLFFMTKARRHFSRRNQRLENATANLELDVMKDYDFNISILSLPFGNKSDESIKGERGFKKVFEYL